MAKDVGYHSLFKVNLVQLVYARKCGDEHGERYLLVLQQFKALGHITYPHYQPLLAILHQLHCHFHRIDACLFF